MATTAASMRCGESAVCNARLALMDLGTVIAIVATAVVTAVVTFASRKLPAVRRSIAKSSRRVGRALNYARRFVFALRRTRRHARASFISRRDGLPLPVLEFTLLRWYDKHPDLIRYLRHARLNNRCENAKREVAKIP